MQKFFSVPGVTAARCVFNHERHEKHERKKMSVSQRHREHRENPGIKAFSFPLCSLCLCEKLLFAIDLSEADSHEKEMQGFNFRSFRYFRGSN
jgi:hypothetical protein